MFLTNTYSSIIVFCQQIIQALPTPVTFIDWEAHANIEELPDADLLGPTAVAITDGGPGEQSVSFAVGVCTYEGDRNLFRHREIMAAVFERMRPERKLTFYDASAGSEESVLVFLPGTTVSPMSRAKSRPWQFVQAESLLVPSSEVS